MNTFLLILSIFFALVAVVLLVLYIRAKKTINEDTNLLRESREMNRQIIRTLHELDTENKRLQSIIDNLKK